MEIGAGRLLLGDTFERMAELPDACADMILADLPYGTTQNKWDSVLPLDRLWAEYWRIAKPNAAIVLTATQPFTSVLVVSQRATFRYPWVWQKSLKTGFLNAKRQPLRQHEDVLVFCRQAPPYYPQMAPEDRKVYGSNKTTGSYGAWKNADRANIKDHKGYPTSVLAIGNPTQTNGHSTQKPVALFEYLIRTYTNPGELVLDNTSGSGTTAIAAEQSGRRWVCIEREPEYYWRSYARIFDHLQQGA